MWQAFAEHGAGLTNLKNPQRAQQKLKLIMEATFRLANQGGFQGMSLRQLSQQCGLSLGGLYGYFDSKEALATSVHRFIDHQFRAWLLPEYEHAHESQKLATLCRYHLYLSELMQPWFFFSYMESRHLSKQAKQQALAMSNQVDTLLLEALSKTDKSVSSPELEVSLIKHQLQGWYLRRSHFKQQGVAVDEYCHYLLQRLGIISE